MMDKLYGIVHTIEEVQFNPIIKTLYDTIESLIEPYNWNIEEDLEAKSAFKFTRIAAINGCVFEHSIWLREHAIELYLEDIHFIFYNDPDFCQKLVDLIK